MLERWNAKIAPLLASFFDECPRGFWTALIHVDEGRSRSFLVTEETIHNPILVSRADWEELQGFRIAAGTQQEANLSEAEKRAYRILWDWLEVTGVIPKGTSSEAEVESVVKDAVSCGWQAAKGHCVPLRAEIDREEP